MFRKMRRINQLLTPEETESILDICSNGVLACLGDNGYPYAVPLNFVYYNKKIYFHSAKMGHKSDALLNYPKISFTVIAAENIISEKYTAHFLSVIVFGKARIAKEEERLAAFTAFVDKYSGDRPEAEKNSQINRCTRSQVFAIDIEYMTGKQKGRE